MNLQFGIQGKELVQPFVFFTRLLAFRAHHALPLLLIAATAAAQSAWAAGGDLDRSFGGGAGYITYAQPYQAHWQITGAVALADGRAVIGGYLDLKYVVRRYFPDGRVDTSFGANGSAVLDDFSRGSASGGVLPGSGPHLYLDALGRIVALNDQGSARRLSADGQYDSNFRPWSINIRGRFDSQWMDYGSNSMTFLPLPDGRMIVVTTQDTQSATDFISVRYFLADGSPDTIRGDANGERLVGSPSGGRYVPTHAALQPDGKLLISAIWVQTASTGLVALRLSVDGTLDASFGEGGVLVIGANLGRVRSSNLSVSAGEKIALAYSVNDGDSPLGSHSYFVVHLLLPNGLTDTSQPMGGRILLPVPDDRGVAVYPGPFRVVLEPSRLSIVARSLFWQMVLPGPGNVPAVSAYWHSRSDWEFLQDRLGGPYLWRFADTELARAGHWSRGYQNSIALAFMLDAVPNGQPTEIRYSETAESWTSMLSAKVRTDGRVTALGVDSDDEHLQTRRLYRFMDNGNLDVGFGSGGVVGDMRFLESRVLDTVGDGATVFGIRWEPGRQGYSILRLNANGQVDGVFGESGILSLPPAWSLLPSGATHDARRLSSGDLWSLGFSQGLGGRIEFWLYDELGKFSGAGCERGSDLGYIDFVAAGAMREGLLAAVVHIDSVLGLRLQLHSCQGNGFYALASSSAVTTIGEHFGYVWAMDVVPFTDAAGAVVALALAQNDLAAQPKYTIVLLGLKPDGSIDASFGDAGKVRIPIEDQSPGFREELTQFRLLRQSDGKLVLAHNVPLGNGTAIVVGRYTADGKPDGSFGSGGNHEVTFSMGGTDSVSDLTQTADGKLVLVGHTGRRGLIARLYGEATPPPATPMPVVEFQNSILNHYFITGGAGEIAGIEAGAAGPGWSRTGLSFKAYAPETGIAPGALPTCRFYGTPGRGPNSHFYTVDSTECELVKQDPGWTYEGLAFYILPPVSGQCAAGTQPVYRAYNMRFAQNDSNHRYTTDAAVYAQMQAQGWAGEGVKFCAPQ